MVLSDVLRCVSYNIVCPCWFWLWYCLTFFDVFHIIPWPKPTRTNNVIQNTSKNVRQYHGQNQREQTMLCKKHRRTSDNTMGCVLPNIVCPCWFWPWYCLTFFDVFWITLFLLVGFGYGIVWHSSMCFVVIQNTSKNVRKYHDQSQQGQAMLYKTHRRMLDNTIAKSNKEKQCYTWYCLTFFDVLCITLLVLVGFGHGMFWRSSMCFA
jgi:hypothetical protein